MGEPHEGRTLLLHDAPVPAGGRWVLYWMQASQRARDNPALDVAVRRANSLGLPVLCVFGLSAAYPEANLRAYAFMLEGLEETRADLAAKGIQLAVLRTEPVDAALALAGDAALVVCDRGYTRHQRAWRRAVAAACTCPLVQVEGDIVVPVDVASGKSEWSAATLRPKIHREMDRFLAAPRAAAPRRDSLGIRVPGALRGPLAGALEGLGLDAGVPPVPGLRGGARQAHARLARFIRDRLAFYGAERQDPALGTQSGLSPYLHFGQVSPVRVAVAAASAATAPEAARAAFLEQLVVRRELAVNFVERTGDYDRFSCVPAWAQKTLAAHARDRREHLYAPAELEAGKTHDPHWNAAMEEMRVAGTLHGHMRMYWGKQILAWSPTPAEGFATALALNNRWFVDGRDPCSYAGVAWCFGLHDRPWAERPVFGMVRSMNDRGLERKFDMDAYRARVAALPRAGRAAGPRGA